MARWRPAGSWWKAGLDSRSARTWAWTSRDTAGVATMPSGDGGVAKGPGRGGWLALRSGFVILVSSLSSGRRRFFRRLLGRRRRGGRGLVGLGRLLGHLLRRQRRAGRAQRGRLLGRAPRGMARHVPAYRGRRGERPAGAARGHYRRVGLGHRGVLLDPAQGARVGEALDGEVVALEVQLDLAG